MAVDPSCKEECFFWDGTTCHFEELIPGGVPCGPCPDNEGDLVAA